MPKESAMLTGVIFSNYKGKIAFIWIVIIIMLFVMIEKRVLRTLTKRVKEKKEYTEIYLWGREYSILLLLQAFVTSVCLQGAIQNLLRKYGKFLYGLSMFWYSLTECMHTRNYSFLRMELLHIISIEKKILV